MSMLRDDEQVRQFWEETEEELGEMVIVYAMGRCLSGCSEIAAPLWGLVFITERAFYFRHFAKPQWLTAFPAGAPGHRNIDEEVYFSIDRDRITNCLVEREPSLLRRMFTEATPVMALTYDVPGDLPQTIHIAVETKFDEFVKFLSHGEIQ